MLLRDETTVGLAVDWGAKCRKDEVNEENEGKEEMVGEFANSTSWDGKALGMVGETKEQEDLLGAKLDGASWSKCRWKKEAKW